MSERRSSKKILILVRHGHRDKQLGHAVDNGVSIKGLKQAKKIARHFREVFAERQPLLLSSPKRRCIETLLPLAEGDESKIKIDPNLDEGELLEARIEKFRRWWRNDAPSLTVACSHGDWIPAFLEHLTGTNAELKKGGWAEIEGTDSQPRLVWLLQEL